MTKVIRLNESDIHRIVKRVLKEQLTQDQLNSPKSKQAKKFQEVFNSLYKANLPVDGNWKDKKYNELKKKWLNEKGLTIHICKKGDGYCNDNDEGEITTKDNVVPLLKKDWMKCCNKGTTQTTTTEPKINTTHDKSYEYKLENGKYYFKSKAKYPDWVESTGKGLESIKKNVKF